MHIVLQLPPPGVHFGLQKGSGSKYETVQLQKSGSGDLHFDLNVTIRGDRIKDQTPRFGGPFAQGSYPDNFIYIDIGTYAGKEDIWSRRLKIPLSGITWEIVDQLTTDADLTLETYVPGTAKDGSPTCATVKPFAGWKIV
ncbi:DUF5990 family protein [Mucilaginibacter sp. BT774]|nr:DUF5990 family protein [Mucilaginibacter sp. BT774]